MSYIHSHLTGEQERHSRQKEQTTTLPFLLYLSAPFSAKLHSVLYAITQLPPGVVGVYVCVFHLV